MVIPSRLKLLTSSFCSFTMTLPNVYFDIAFGTSKIGRIVFELFPNVPRTSNNFHQLCLKPSGSGYKDSIFHRIIKDFMCQGGDFTNGNGTGGVSIYGEKFADENFIHKHSEPYLLSMANSGVNTNGSQFFITTGVCEWLNGKHVVFGKVIKGIDVVKKMNEIEVKGQAPKQVVKIVDCGEC